MTDGDQPAAAGGPWTVAPERDGDRLAAFLRSQRPSLSQTRARALCELGAVAVDGIVTTRPAERLVAGAIVTMQAADVELSLRLGLPIVRHAHGVLIVHKPPGLAVHKGPLVDDSVAARLAAGLPAAGLAQRLDRDASGLLLCGADRATLRHLGLAMASGAIERHYLGIVVGSVDGDHRTIDLPLSSTDQPMGDQPKVVVDHDHGQRAVTHLDVVARARTTTLVRLRLETGRTHQIRAHLRAIGHPLLGDPRYGDADANAAAHRTHGILRTLLHCERLRVPPPPDVADALPIDASACTEPDFARLFPPAR